MHYKPNEGGSMKTKQPNLLDLYTDYLISQNYHATATGLASLLEGEVSHDQVTRFLNKNNFGPKELWKFVKAKVRNCQQETDGALIIDDTIEEKPYTDENEIVSWHYSHTKGHQVKGINLLTCLVRYGDRALPITYDIVAKDQAYVEPKTGKQKKRSTISKNERFRSLIKQAVKNQVKFDYIIADSWFSSKENMQYIDQKLGKKFIFALKTNRLVAVANEDGTKGTFQDLNSVNLQDNEKKKVYLTGIDFAVVIVKKEFTNEDGTRGTLYLVSNDIDKEGTLLYQTYQKRWLVEEYHKSIKENASLAKSPTKVETSQRNHIFSSMIAYCKLEFLSIKTSINHFALKYKLILKANQAALIELQRLQRLQATISTA